MGARFGRAYPPYRIYHNNYLALPVFSSVATGASVNAASLSWTHTASAGDSVFIFVASYGNYGATSVTYGGVATTALQTVAFDGNGTYGYLEAFRATSVAGGASTVAVTMTGSTYTTGCSIGIQQATTLGTIGTAAGFNSITQSLSLGLGQLAVQAFGAYGAFTPSGGTNKFDNGVANAWMSISIASVTTTFTASSSSSYWAGIAIPVN